MSLRTDAQTTLNATNCLPGDWYGLFPNPVLAEGLLDRLVNTSYPVVLEGRGFAPSGAPGANPPRRRPRPAEGPGEYDGHRPVEYDGR